MPSNTTNIITEWNHVSCGFTYRGVIAHQNPCVQIVFPQFFKEHPDITRIIEIGTSHGGLSLLLSDFTKDNVEIYSYDIVDYGDSNSIARTECVHRVIRKLKNVFLPETIDEIKALIHENTSGRTMIICDGGNKINEFNIFSNFLRSGDIIMAHDFARTKEEYEKKICGKRWNWCQITENDIRDTCSRNQLVDYYQPAFWESAFTCKMKI